MRRNQSFTDGTGCVSQKVVQQGVSDNRGENDLPLESRGTAYDIRQRPRVQESCRNECRKSYQSAENPSLQRNSALQNRTIAASKYSVANAYPLLDRRVTLCVPRHRLGRCLFPPR